MVFDDLVMMRINCVVLGGSLAGVMRKFPRGARVQKRSDGLGDVCFSSFT